MGNAYEIYALRYATMSPRTPHLNFLVPDPHETTAQDLDYFVWLIRGGGRDILVDTGFNAEEAKARSRKLTLNPVDALANFGVAADTIKRRHRHPFALRPRRQSRSLPERAVSSAGPRDELRDRALHVQRHAAASVFGRARHHDGAPCLWRARHLPFRRRRDRARRDGASRRRPFRWPAGGAGRDRARAGGAGVGRRALLRQSAEAQPVSDRLQCRRHGAGLGDRRAAGRPSRPLHPRPRSDRERDLSARQRQGRCVRACIWRRRDRS